MHKNPTQRRHYVLAKDRALAEPILDTLFKNGLRRENIRFLDSGLELHSQKPENLTFIYGPDYADHPRWLTFREQIFLLVGIGATVKPVPVRRLIDEIDEIDQADAEALVERWSETTRATAHSRLATLERSAPEELTGGLWDLLGKPVQSDGAGGYTEAPPPPVPVPEAPKYKQYYLGGHLHAKRRHHVASEARYEVHALSPIKPRFYEDAPVQDLPQTVVYTAWPVNVLGEELTFYIHEDHWADRQRLVREFLLYPLEV